MEKLQNLRVLERQHMIKEYFKHTVLICGCVDPISRRLLSHTKYNIYEIWLRSKASNT